MILRLTRTLCTLGFLLAYAPSLLAQTTPAQVTAIPTAEEVLINEAALMVRTVLEDKDFRHVRPYMEQSKGLLLFPRLIKGGFLFFGGRGGKGVLLIHQGPDQWSQPVFVKISGLSFGLQFGGQVAELTVVIMTDKGLKAALDGTFTVGGDISASALQKGAGIGVQLDLTNATDMYAVSRSKGLFIGGVLEGSKIDIDQQANDLYYATETTVENTITGALYGNTLNQALLNVLP